MVTEKGPGSANLQMCYVFPGAVSRLPQHRSNQFSGKAFFSSPDSCRELVVVFFLKGNTPILYVGS